MRRRDGFTLLELLIVVATVGILLATLLPALRGARQAARSAECSANLRQLQVANDLYAQDHAERYMPAASEFAARNLRRWHGTRSIASAAFEARGAPVTPYLDGEGLSRAVRACPEFMPTLKRLSNEGAGFEAACGGYGYNAAFVGAERRAFTPGVWTLVSDVVGSRRAQFAAPAGTVGFADTAFAGAGLIEYSFVEPPFWPDFPGARPDPSVHFRHSGRAGVVWLDGHVDLRKMAYTQRSGFYPLEPGPLGIGWFGDVDSLSDFDYQ
ncbi:MAG: type II secretion system protein [Planctomycetota bacterium]|nr:type II secretion system protein [Planctomycetota bacterium]